MLFVNGILVTTQTAVSIDETLEFASVGANYFVNTYTSTSVKMFEE